MKKNLGIFAVVLLVAIALCGCDAKIMLPGHTFQGEKNGATFTVSFTKDTLTHVMKSGDTEILNETLPYTAEDTKIYYRPSTISQGVQFYGYYINGKIYLDGTGSTLKRVK